MSQLRLVFFGSFHAWLDGRPLSELTSPKTQALLAYLVLEGERPHPRELLAELLWPDHPPGKGLQNLRQLLSRLNKALPEAGDSTPILRITRQSVRLHPQAQIEADVSAFTGAIAFTQRHPHHRLEHCRRCAGRLEEAAALYRGDFLEGVYTQSVTFDEWATLKREWLRREALAALDTLAEFYFWLGDASQAYRHAWRQVELDPMREKAHRQAMSALAALERRSDALAQYARLERILSTELAVAPALETRRLYQQILTGTYHPEPMRRPQMSGFPVQHTPFVGRARELAQAAERLDHPDCHLLTLTGLGGVGKSRLAAQIAWEKAGEFADGALFIALAELPSAEYLLSAVLKALEILPASLPARPEERKDRLLAELRLRDLLLVLDNYEHLLPDTRLVVDILREAPRVKLLVTSRQPLNLRAEWLLELDGLAFPDSMSEKRWGPAGVVSEPKPGTRRGLAPFISRAHPSKSTPIREIEGYPAVQLFCQNAARVRDDFKLSPADVADVVRICQLLDGLPLGLELAAAWMRQISLPAIAEQIKRSLDFLETAWSDMPARHRSLRVVFEHSWKLLDLGEQHDLQALAVFRGTFTQASAAAVAGVSAGGLATLVEKSLVRRLEPEGYVLQRYGLHETLRQYAAEKLRQDTQAAQQTAARHAAYFTGLLGLQGRSQEGADEEPNQNAIEIELANIRQAWEWACAGPDLHSLERAWLGLARFYRNVSSLEEGYAAFSRAAEAVRPCAQGEESRADCQALLAGLLAEQAYFLAGLGQYQGGYAAAQEAIALTAAVDRPELFARAALQAGHILRRLGETRAAQEQLSAARQSARSAGLPRVEADALRQMADGWVRMGDYAGAQRDYAESLAICKRCRYRVGEAYALSGLGSVSLVREKPAEARGYYQQALEIYQEAGDQVGGSTTLDNLGTTYWAEGRYTQAEHIHRQALEIRRRIGDRRGQGATLVRLAIQAHYQGDFDGAERDYSEALAIYRQIGYLRGEGEILAHLCLLYHYRGQHVAALAYGKQAEELARRSGDRSDLAYALYFSGNACLGLNDLAGAGQAYDEAYQIRSELGEYNRAMEPLAGLAQVALRAGDLPGALQYAGRILAHLESGSLEVTDEPLRVYLACCEVLEACQDGRAAAVLARAGELLEARAAGIDDLQLRHAYQTQIPAHRQLRQRLRLP